MTKMERIILFVLESTLTVEFGFLMWLYKFYTANLKMQWLSAVLPVATFFYSI